MNANGTPARARRSLPLRATRRRAEPPLLSADHIDFSYGPLQILFDVSIEVDKGDAVALLGTNGAGKSTLLKAVSGLARPTRGCVRLRGEDVTALPAEERVGLGLTLVEGGKAMFPSLPVQENLRLGAYPKRRERALVTERVELALDLFPALRPKLDQLAGTLSGGEQQMVAIGRALVAGSDLLIIDELSLGLAPVVMEQILRAIEQLLAMGQTLLLVEQSLNVALNLTSRAYFMEKGEVKFSGPTRELLERGDLVRSVFFGSEGAA